jgi:hypothetical protein
MINLIIFRIPSDDGEATLVELDYVGGELSVSGKVFGVREGDSYANLPFDRIVLAEKTEEGSVSHAVYQIGKSDLKTPENVNEIDRDSLRTIVSFLIKEHEKSLTETASSKKKLH